MPTPVAHGLAGACIAVLVARRLPAARALPVVAAILFAVNLPDVDFLALVRGREAVERFHQGPLHSIGFVAVATVPLALLLRRRLGLPCAWLLLAGAGLTHLLLDLMVVDRKPPVGLPLFWPWTTGLFHAPVEIFPGVDRADVFSATNLREVFVELAFGIPALLFAGWRSRTAVIQWPAVRWFFRR
jgi:membrane-bound metal-dependent hydrolase YbcI (DUF457 family)